MAKDCACPLRLGTNKDICPLRPREGQDSLYQLPCLSDPEQQGVNFLPSSSLVCHQIVSTLHPLSLLLVPRALRTKSQPLIVALLALPSSSPHSHVHQFLKGTLCTGCFLYLKPTLIYPPPTAWHELLCILQVPAQMLPPPRSPPCHF